MKSAYSYGVHLIDVSCWIHIPDVNVRTTSGRPPTNNLRLQSQIISRATAFVGTYGGLSYLGPYYKVPTIAFYSDSHELVPAHVDATWRLCQATRTPLTMMHVGDAALVASTLDGFGA
jgi:hypothetical protein